MKDYYTIKRVSNSSLSWFQVSPKYFKMMLDKEIEEENAFIFEKGEMVHAFILEPKEFDKNYVFLDYESPKSQQQKDFCDHVARYKDKVNPDLLLRAYKDAYSSKEKDEILLEKAEKLANQFKDYIKSIKLSTVKKVLPKSMQVKLAEIKEKIIDHRIARELLFNEQNETFGNTEELFISNELPILWLFPNGVECKSMLDRIIIDHKNKVIKLVDLKTTSSFKEFREKFNNYSYYRQMAFYWLAIKSYFKESNLNGFDDYKKETYVICINMKEPTEIKVYSVKENTLGRGLDEIELLMKQLKWHFDNNKWDYPMYYYEGKGIEDI